jgi:site-specific DNA recombinase
MKERVALYARVSTSRQEQEKTIASQIEAILEMVTRRGLTIAPERRFIDDGFSGARLDRPALDALRDAAADGLLDVVFIHAPDRLARNYVYQHVVLEELDRRGVEVHFVESPLGERPEDRLLVQMQGVIAEYERAKILERTRRGRLHKVRAGQMLPFPCAPYGYAIVRTPEVPWGVLVIDEVEAGHVRAMYRWVLDEGLSARQVAKRLNALKVPARRAPLWLVSSTYNILTNSVYAGQATYGKHEPVEPKKPRAPGAYRKRLKSSRRRRPPSQWLTVSVPAIVDATMQQDVRARLARNVIMATRNTRYEYLLRTLVVCGQCGRKMGCERQVSRHRHVAYEYFYYGCARRDPVDTGESQRCTSRSVRATELDAVVWGALREWLERPQILRQHLAAWRTQTPSGDYATRERVRLEQAIEQVRRQVERLVDAYQRGAIEVDELKARRERLEASQQAAEERLVEVQARQQQRVRSERLLEDIAAFAKTVGRGLDALDFAGRQRLVRLLVERVVVRESTVTVEHVVPLSGRFSELRLGNADTSQVAQEPQWHEGVGATLMLHQHVNERLAPGDRGAEEQVGALLGELGVDEGRRQERERRPIEACDDGGRQHRAQLAFSVLGVGEHVSEEAIVRRRHRRAIVRGRGQRGGEASRAARARYST